MSAPSADEVKAAGEKQLLVDVKEVALCVCSLLATSSGIKDDNKAVEYMAAALPAITVLIENYFKGLEVSCNKKFFLEDMSFN